MARLALAPDNMTTVQMPSAPEFSASDCDDFIPSWHLLYAEKFWRPRVIKVPMKYLELGRHPGCEGLRGNGTPFTLAWVIMQS